jgi:hypothetical protein
LFAQLNLNKSKSQSLLAGGNSGTQSKHFMIKPKCKKGQFKDVLFYKEDILKHLKNYHPGE